MARARFAVCGVDSEATSGSGDLPAVLPAGILSFLRRGEVEEGSTLRLASIIGKNSDPLRPQVETTEDALQLTKANNEDFTDHALKIHPRHDDSDLLIIEDEVDIHHLEQRQASDATRQNSIDYKRMLKRMRSKC